MVNRTYVFVFMLVTFPSETIFGQMIQLTDQWGTVDVKSGEYRVYNNVWGASTPQTLTVDTGSTYFTINSTGHNLPSNGAPASYPFILKGSHFGGTPTPMNDPFPIVVSKIQNCSTTWNISGTTAPGVWDCAYDIWFVQNGNNKLEMMIWINYQGPQPAGGQVTTATINGISWQVWWNNSSTLSYRIVTKRDSCNLDIRNFMNDAVTRGYLDTAWSLGAVEAGFEIWQNGAGLTSDSFSVDTETVTEVDGPVDIRPSGFRLEQNYPNPFNPSTVINYQLAMNSQVTLKVYDVLGREVETLLSEPQTVGSHSVTFNATNLPSGVYFYRLQVVDPVRGTGSYTATKRLLLLK
ncbi:MAG TPA: T9SS type A sorting domain-containing protein [Candidatus Acidoferrales bacterium]|nr:T9SS type A sorting domain-containing protein [Candidatus Acidoferrales bacterium]